MKTGKLFVPPYGDEIRIVQTKKLKEAKEYYLKNKPKEYDNNVSVLEHTYDNGGACFYTCEDLHFVFFMDKPKTIWELSTVVHESLHLTNRILYRRGLHLSPETEEAFTYLQQFLFKEISHFLGVKVK